MNDYYNSQKRNIYSSDKNRDGYFDQKCLINGNKRGNSLSSRNEKQNNQSPQGKDFLAKSNDIKSIITQLEKSDAINSPKNKVRYTFLD
jgi:hypothetical protein